MDGLVRVGILLQHLLAAAKEIENHRLENLTEGQKNSERVLALAREIGATPEGNEGTTTLKRQPA